MERVDWMTKIGVFIYNDSVSSLHVTPKFVLYLRTHTCMYIDVD